MILIWKNFKKSFIYNALEDGWKIKKKIIYILKKNMNNKKYFNFILGEF